MSSMSLLEEQIVVLIQKLEEAKEAERVERLWLRGPTKRRSVGYGRKQRHVLSTRDVTWKTVTLSRRGRRRGRDVDGRARRQHCLQR